MIMAMVIMRVEEQQRQLERQLTRVRGQLATGTQVIKVKGQSTEVCDDYNGKGDDDDNYDITMIMMKMTATMMVMMMVIMLVIMVMMMMMMIIMRVEEQQRLLKKQLSRVRGQLATGTKISWVKGQSTHYVMVIMERVMMTIIII